MCNEDFRPEAIIAAGSPPPALATPKLSSRLLEEMAVLNAHDRIRSASAPVNTDGRGDYISLT